jgi:hypothetical protein
MHAARELEHVASWPEQYLRAAPRGTPKREADPVPHVRSKQTASA